MAIENITTMYDLNSLRSLREEVLEQLYSPLIRAEIDDRTPKINYGITLI